MFVHCSCESHRHLCDRGRSYRIRIKMHTEFKFQSSFCHNNNKQANLWVLWPSQLLGPLLGSLFICHGHGLRVNRKRGQDVRFRISFEETWFLTQNKVFTEVSFDEIFVKLCQMLEPQDQEHANCRSSSQNSICMDGKRQWVQRYHNLNPIQT